MKKFLLLFLITFFFNNCIANAIEEIVLEKEERNLNLDYISDLYYGKVEDYENVSPALKLFSQKGLEFENSKINSVKASFLYEGRLFYNQTDHNGQYLTHDFFTVEPMITVNFNENKSKFMFDYNLTRRLAGYSNGFTERISQVYISHKLTPNQTLLLGQGDRLPNSYDGSRGVMGQEMVLKSQLGRTLGECRSVGIRNIADYKYLNYDIGLYDSTRYMKDFGNGADFTGHIMFKPLANVSERTGDFKIGAGYNIGNNNISYNMYSLFVGYDYRKFHIHAEYANADGYNAIKESRNKANGFYTLASYDITPKLEVLARFDVFDGNKNVSNNTNIEYAAGFTYKIFKNMKFLLNYVKRNYENQPDSNMILFATRFII